MFDDKENIESNITSGREMPEMDFDRASAISGSDHKRSFGFKDSLSSIGEHFMTGST